MSTFHLAERKLSSSISEIKRERQVVDSLKWQVDLEKKSAFIAASTIVSKNEMIAYLEGKVQECNQTISDLQR